MSIFLTQKELFLPFQLMLKLTKSVLFSMDPMKTVRGFLLNFSKLVGILLIIKYALFC